LPTTSAASARSSVSTLSSDDLKANLHARRAQYDELYSFVSPRIGRRPAIIDSQIRNSAWTRLCKVATTREELEKVVELMPKWRDGKREFNVSNSKAFVARCDELHCPDLALKVFGDHSKYSLPLSQAGARHLLFSLHARYPLSDTITASEFWRVYNLKPVHDDPVSCAILASACLMDARNHPQDQAQAPASQSRNLGMAMLDQLKTLLPDKLPPKKLNDLPRIWLEKALGRIDRMIDSMENSEELEWVRTWRTNNGCRQDPAAE